MCKCATGGKKLKITSNNINPTLFTKTRADYTCKMSNTKMGKLGKKQN